MISQPNRDRHCGVRLNADFVVELDPWVEKPRRQDTASLFSFILVLDKDHFESW